MAAPTLSAVRPDLREQETQLARLDGGPGPASGPTTWKAWETRYKGVTARLKALNAPLPVPTPTPTPTPVPTPTPTPTPVPTPTPTPVPADRIPQITTSYGGRPGYVPQAFLDKIAAEAHDPIHHPPLGPFQVNQIKAGRFSDPTIYDVGRLPIDGESANFPFDIHIDVKSRVKHKNLHFKNVTWEPGSELWYSTMNTHGSEVCHGPNRQVFHALEDPGQTVKVGKINMGPVTYTSPQKQTIARVDQTIPAGAKSAPIVGLSGMNWQVDDDLLLVSTEYAGTSATDLTYTGPPKVHTGLRGGKCGFMQVKSQEVKITRIVGDVVHWDEPLTQAMTLYVRIHWKTGFTVRMRPAISNLTKPIVIATDPANVHDPKKRGQWMIMHDPRCHIDGVECDDWGRTRLDGSLAGPDGKTLTDGAGNVITDPDNVIGRYAGIHLHNLGPYFARGQAVVKNVVARATKGAPPLPGRVFVHHSSNASFENCVAFRFRGAGFTSEMGDEIGQWIDNLAVGGIGDGYASEDWNSRHETLLGHHGHQGVAYDCQARQVLCQGNLFSEAHLGWIYHQQDNKPLERVPDPLSVRHTHPLAPVDLPEQTQIPDFNHNCGWGARRAFVVGHRARTWRWDSTPARILRCHWINCGQRGLDAFNYTSNYFPIECWWHGVPGSTAALIMGTMVWTFSTLRMMLDGFNAGYADWGAGFNYEGVFVDTDFGTVKQPFSQSQFGAQGDPAAHPYRNTYPSFKVVSQTPTDYTYWLRTWRDLDSAKDFPDADNPSPIGGGAADPGLALAKPYFVLDQGCDLTLGPWNNIAISGTIVDAVGPRHFPSATSWSGSTKANYINVKPMRNACTPEQVVERNGCFKDAAGAWKSRLWFSTVDRSTGDYFQWPVEINLTGFTPAFLAANTVDPATKPELPLKPEATPLTALV